MPQVQAARRSTALLKLKRSKSSKGSKSVRRSKSDRSKSSRSRVKSSNSRSSKSQRPVDKSGSRRGSSKSRPQRKRKVTGFFKFMKKIRPTVVAGLPAHKRNEVTVVSSECGKRWRELSDSQRQKYLR